jgi:signal peptide peptidase SppA
VRIPDALIGIVRIPDAVMHFYERPFAVLPSWLEAMENSRFSGVVPRPVDARGPRISAPSGSIAVLPLVGPILQRSSIWDFFGATNLEQFAASFREALANPGVSTIVLDVDSPGGEIFGTPEMAAEIFAARGVKKIIAVVNSFAASAAYWIASAADELVMTPSGQTGSIGVYALHLDFSKQLEAAGVKATFISAGAYKTDGNDLQPLSDSARGALQKSVDEYYGAFVRAVAAHRGVAQKTVRDGYGQGRVVGAAEAESLGMVDRIATLRETLQRLGAAGRRASARAEIGRERLAIERLS